MSDNNEKWKVLINDSFRYPEELLGTEDRLNRRINKEKRKKRTLTGSISALAASLTFVLLVNTSTAFANVVAEMPVLGKLAEFVRFDKSLSRAIENEYVQEVNLVSWDGSNSLMLPYVIADEKNMVLFFQLPDKFKQTENQWINIFNESIVNAATGEKVEGYGCSSSGLSPEGRKENFGFIMQEYNFSEGKLPESIDIEVRAEIENIMSSDGAAIAHAADESKESSSLEKIGTFKFHIELGKFAEPKIYEINERHTILGQQIVIDNIRVYPTGTEVNVSFPEENSALIKGIDMEIVQDDNTVYGGNNGMISSNDVGNKGMSIYIESNYFSKPKKQKLLIKAARLLDKDEEYITVDIDKGTIDPEIKDTELKQIIKASGNATLIFSTETDENDMFGMFDHLYEDLEGKPYEFKSEGSTYINSRMETMFTVKNPPGGKVILKRALTPKKHLEKPLVINIP